MNAQNRMAILPMPNNAINITNVAMALLQKSYAQTAWFLMITAVNMKSVIYLLTSIVHPDQIYVSLITRLSPLVIQRRILFIEEPQPSEHCRRKHGYFSHEDTKICDKFYYCVDGKFNMITCPNGLVYSDKTGICSWPDEAKKKGCSSEGQCP